MALIDVSDLLVDPDFVDAIQIITRTPTVDNFGQNSTADVIMNTVGCVQPASGDAIARLPDALQNQNATSFFVRGPIITTDLNLYPSILVFQGVRYEVKSVNDWTNYGFGWSEGICVAEKPSQ